LKHKKTFYLALALVCAVIAAGSVYFYLSELEAKTRDATEFDKVLVAKDTIPPRTRVSPEMFEEKDYPAGYVHPQAVRSVDDISDGITTAAVYSGEQVLDDKIARDGEAEDGFAYKISEGKRALAVDVNKVVAVGGLLLPGDRVDVIATLEVPEEDEDGGDSSTLLSKVIIENLKVLSVGQNYESLASDRGTDSQTVTLEIAPDDAPSLTLATERGNIRMMLRSPVDEESVRTDSWEMQDFR